LKRRSRSYRLLREKVSAAKWLIETIEQRRQEAAEANLAGAGDRIVLLRSGLAAIARGDDEPRLTAQDALAHDDRLLEAAKSRPVEIQRLNEEWALAKSQLATLEKSLNEAEAVAAQAEQLQYWRDDQAKATADLNSAREALPEAEGLASLHRKEIEGLRKVETLFEQSRTAIQARIEALRPTCDLAPKLLEAETRLATYEPQLESLQAGIADLNAQLEALGKTPTVLPAPDVSSVELKAGELNLRSINAHTARAIAEQRLAYVVESSERLRSTEGLLKTAGDELADWTRLSEDLGRDGLQALEIDAAGPELTALINDLLQSCVGSRFTVSVETTRQSADGKKQLEGCDVRVLDTLRGREANAETLSGGERVIVGEAIALALSMLSLRRSHVVGPTLGP
jgi:exonuclease SbcC